MGRHIQKKCLHCATLPVEVASVLHGPDGDNCWNPKLCHRKRSHYRHREDNNSSRRRFRKTGKLSTKQPGDFVEVTPPTPPLANAAVLVLYRQHKNAPVHAVAAEVWSGSVKIAGVKPVHCMGMRGDRVREYIQEMLELLEQQFGVSRFEDVIKEIPVEECPISPCPLHPS